MQQAITILYDGECPFCANYIALQRLREAHNVELIDARKRPDLVANYREQGYEINDGMIVTISGTIYSGGDAMHQITRIAGEAGTVKYLINLPFRSRLASLLLYPLLRTGRNLTLRARGRKPL